MDPEPIEPWELLPTEVVCPTCHLTHHKHLPACPTCEESQ